jgi:hypothetical protein
MTNTNSWEGLLFDIVSSTKEGIAKGVDFAIQQSPDLVNQLLRWNLVSNISWFVIFLGLDCVLGYVDYRFITYPIDSDGKFFGSTLISILIIVFSFIAVNFALDAVKILVAPKIFLVEYLYAKTNKQEAA